MNTLHAETVAETSTALNEALSKPDAKPAPPSSDCDLLLIDVSHLFWAAWHATAAEEVSAAFSATIARLHAIRAGTFCGRLAVCMDWPPYWRVEICSEYKAQRARPSEHAVAQFRRVRNRIRAEGLTVLGARGFEADDVIATAVRLATERGLSVTIATGDKDLMQLVSESVVVSDTRTDAVYGPEQVVARYGVAPGKIRDLLTLTGDSSDNIPGVKGVGIKKAADLLRKFGDWRASVQAAKEFSHAIPKGLAKLLREHDDYELAWKLVGLREDVPITLDAALGLSAAPVEPAKDSTTETETVRETPMEREKSMSSKMSLENVSEGCVGGPFDIIMYGPEGTGKSTFASKAPSPIFFDIEHGTEELAIKRMPEPENWTEFVQGMTALAKDRHNYKTCVIDTADALELLIHRHVCEKGGEKSIEDFPFGKGTLAALKLWRDLVEMLRVLRAKGMHTILLAHSEVRPFSNPRGQDFDRYQLKLAKKSGDFLKDRAKTVLFVTYDEATKQMKGSAKSKAFGEGHRVVYTQYRPAFDAKNRYGLPFEMALDWDEFEAAARAGQVAPIEQIREELTALMADLDDANREKLSASIQRAGDDASKLTQLVDWARNKASGKAGSKEAA